MGADLIIETATQCIAVEIKLSRQARDNMFRGLTRFAQIAGRSITPYVVYQREFAQRFNNLGSALPYEKFLGEVLPQLD